MAISNSRQTGPFKAMPTQPVNLGFVQEIK